MIKVQRQLKRLLIGIVGGLVLLLGILMIPYPGPGWLVVFFGLTILATEFMWARGLLDKARAKYDGWTNWIKQQPLYTQVAFAGATFVLVVVTIWLFNGYGIVNAWFGLEQDWLVSPLIQIDPTP